MKVIVIYDSVYGNTEQIARAIGSALAPLANVQVLRASQVNPEQLKGCELLLVGSPTQRSRPIAPVTDMLKRIPANSLKGIKIAAFDTRMMQKDIDAQPILPLFVKIFGFAARPIGDALVKKGGKQIAAPEGFYITGMEGPLLEGELERASNWARQIVETMAGERVVSG